ncbi:MAG TPA: hypothetical protein VEZ42_15850 [Pseudonocardia sp.]|nr:hypothetical protein [Pseudonocardia sp.]
MILGTALISTGYLALLVLACRWASGPPEVRAAWRAHRRAVRARERAERRDRRDRGC